MGFLKEFKAFALKGNVMDMAVGVIIGGAFGKIVTSLVNDILMPPIGMLLGNVDFKDLKVNLAALKDAAVSVVNEGAVPSEPVYWNYGAFIQQCIDFAILAFCVFLLVKLMNRLSNLKKKKEEEAPATPPAPPAPSKEEVLLTEIRDLLKEKK
ncbi:MAG: large-conductance mechanosensitive channel protein MscL [Rikenellaceae bacterium]|nr:large-conductance mechanosensitive channel protein MscL [Rikenellaceae bacterium]